MDYASAQLMPFTKRMASSSGEDGSAAWLAGRSIRSYGVRIGIRTNRRELLDQILAYAPPLWKPTSVSYVERMFSFRLRGGGSKNSGSHVLLDSLDSDVKSRNLKTILEAFQFRLKMYVAEMARHRVFVHAGVVGWRGKAIIVPGRSMSGTTSLVAELVRAGATYYSDEYAVLDMLGRVHPYPEPLAIRNKGSVKQKKTPAEEIGGIIGIKPLPVGQVVICRFQTGARWRPKKLSAGQAVLELLANTIPARRKPEVVIPTLHSVMSAAIAFKSVRGEARETARLILGEVDAPDNVGETKRHVLTAKTAKTAPYSKGNARLNNKVYA
jgi:hypothetical protein